MMAKRKCLEKQFCEVADAVDRIFKEREKEDKLVERIEKLEEKLAELRGKHRLQVDKRVMVAHKADDLERELNKRIRAASEVGVEMEASEVKNRAYCTMYEALEMVTGRKIDYRIC
jgi:molybdopterin converting factor small subunit